MSFEDLLQLLIIGGAGLAWLLGGTKSKPAPPQQRPRRPPQRRPQAGRQPAPRRAPESWDVKAPEPPTRVVISPRAPAPERQSAETMADEIYRILSGEVVEAEREESLEIIREEAAPVPESLEEIRDAEAYSLETLEPAGEASHRRFHEKYLTPAAAPTRAAKGARRRPALGAGSLREAMLWHEILGPPKAFRD